MSTKVKNPSHRFGSTGFTNCSYCGQHYTINGIKTHWRHCGKREEHVHKRREEMEAFVPATTGRRVPQQASKAERHAVQQSALSHILVKHYSKQMTMQLVEQIKDELIAAMTTGTKAWAFN